MLSLYVFMSIRTFAEFTCPQVSFEASCIDGEWNITANSDSPDWYLYATSTGTPCRIGEMIKEVVWKDANNNSRTIGSTCFYNFLDHKNIIMGTADFYGPEFVPGHGPWERRKDYTQYSSCRESQQKCQFRKVSRP